MGNTREIIKANLDDVNIIADVLGEAFYNEPIFVHIAGRADFARDFFESEFRNIYALLDCSFYIIDENDQVMGCTLWAKPGQTLSSSPLALLRVAETVLDGAGIDSFKRFVELAEFLERNHPREPHYYLRAIGVKNSFRGKGVGSSLLAHVLDMADNEQVPAYLENSNELNLPLYQKYGFKVIEKKNTPNGGPPLWFMHRSPKISNPPNE